MEELLERYEDMIRNGERVYFDSDEFEDIADYYDMRENPEAALNVVEEGLKQHPGNQNLLLRKIRAFIFNEQYSEASNLINGLSIDTSDSEVLLLKAEIFLNTGSVQSGLSMLDLVLEQDDDEYTLLEISDILKSVEMYDEAMNFLKKGFVKYPENMDILREIADNYRSENNFDAAIEIYNKILDDDPYSAEDWTDLGELFSLKADYEKAIEAFDFSLTIDESDDRTIFMKGNCYILNGNFEKAIETYHDYITFNPTDETPYILIAECYEEMNQYEQAFDYCLSAILASNNSILSLKKMIYFLMDRECFEEAMEYANKALAITKKDSNLFFLKADIFTALNKSDEAADYYKKALAVSTDPNEKNDILFSIGVLKQKEGDDENALFFFEQIENNEFIYPDLFLKMAVSYHETKQYDKCAECLEKTKNEPIDELSPEEISEREKAIRELTLLLEETGHRY